MSDSRPSSQPHRSRDEILDLARSDKTNPHLLEELAESVPFDPEVWQALFANPRTPLATLIHLVQIAPSAFLGLLLDHPRLIRGATLANTMLRNPTTTDVQRKRIHALLSDLEREEEGRKKSLLQQIREMTTGEKLALAKKGGKEARMILIKDPNELIALEVVNGPRITDAEILSVAQMRDVSEKVLRAIAENRRYRSRKGVVLSLLHNPKTPVGVSLGLGLTGLSIRELDGLAKNRNIPAALSRAAKQILDRRQRGPGGGPGH